MNRCRLLETFLIFVFLQNSFIANSTSAVLMSNDANEKLDDGDQKVAFGKAPSFSTSKFKPSEKPDYPSGNDEGNATATSRKLQVNQITKKVIMLLYDKERGISEMYDQILPPKNRMDSSFSRTDFIFRLQEKYEYSTCNSYVDIDSSKNLFQYDVDLVNLVNDNDTDYKGTKESRANRIKRAKDTFNSRYRMWGEDCDPDAEWEFWRDMFIAAENDTIAIRKKTDEQTAAPCTPSPTDDCSSSPMLPPPPPPEPPFTNPHEGNLEEFDYVKIEKQDMMKRWDEIWRKHKTKGVCNPRLLLECPDSEMVIPKGGHTFAYSEEKKCRCRTNGVGLPTIVRQKLEGLGSFYKIPANVYTRQYYEDLEENVHDAAVRHYGKYVHKKKCVVAASVPNTWKDGQILNPCDYFLPMIGLCSADCHKNATCLHVNSDEKMIVQESSKKIDFYKRIREDRVHEVYYQKCICKKGHHCRKENEVLFEGATTFRKGNWFGESVVFVILQTILFKICML